MQKKTILILILFLALPIVAGCSGREGEIMDKIPIIFSKHYDITFLWVEKLQPFDTTKYSKTYNFLLKNTGLRKNQFYSPVEVSMDDLLSVHSPEYLKSLKNSRNISRIAELGILSIIPGYILDRRILKPMRYATGGTILGCRLALEHGWAINLSGGYHHAKAEVGGGFCFYADIPIAVYRLLKEKPDIRVLVVDLDAHQGNGLESVFGEDERIDIFDMYNGGIYPYDNPVKKYIKYNHPVRIEAETEEYLLKLKACLPEAIRRSSPDLIVYNAGTDIFLGDPLGALNVSEKGIIIRDEFVFESALRNKIPILMVLSGGYIRKSAEIIGKSIENILRNVVKVDIPVENTD